MTLAPRTAPYSAPAKECKGCPYAIACVIDPPKNQKTPRIGPRIALDCVFRGLSPSNSVRGMIDRLENQVRNAADARFGKRAGSTISGGIANVRGDWLEQILAVIFANITADGSYGNTAIVRLPDTDKMEFRELFKSVPKGYLDDLYQSLKDRGISLTMSNPDFVCVTNLSDDIMEEIGGDVVLGEATVDKLSKAYESVRGQCDPFSIPFVLTVKTSVRPDRRYQIVHEANVVKALGAHLASRYWKKDLYFPFYALIANKVSKSDREVLKNPVTHTLVQVSWDPVSVVDEVYEIDSVEDIEQEIRTLLDKHIAATA